MNIADEIKQRVSIQDVLSMYGFESNRSGFICCPFHSEKTASLKIYPKENTFHCFGCGEHGDVISFVMKLFGLNFGQAVLRINEDFGLGLGGGRPNRRKSAELSRKKAEQEAGRMEQKRLLNEMSVYRRTLWNIVLNQRPKSMEEQPSKDFVFALKEIDYLDYYIFSLMEERR